MGATIQGFHTHKPCDGCSVGYYNQVIIASLNDDLHTLVDGEMLLYTTPIAGFYLVSCLLTWRWSNHHWAVMAFLEIMFANGLNLLYITFISILDNVDLLWGSFFPTVAMLYSLSSSLLHAITSCANPTKSRDRD